MRRRLDHKDHRRDLADNRYVYAVMSRRAGGLSIGINLNPDKVCNFDCPYCQVDRTVPGGSREVDLERMEMELDTLLAHVSDGTLWAMSPFDTALEAQRRVVDIAFAGDGEPTSCPGFADAVMRVGRMRAGYGLTNVRIVVLSNATLFHRPIVQRGLLALDALGGEVWAKLDAGTPEWFATVAGTRWPFDRVIDNIKQVAAEQQIVLQCMFHTWDGQPPSDIEVHAWAERIGEILDEGGQIRQVQVYSVARSPADIRVGVLGVTRLNAIAAAARSVIQKRAAGTEVVVYPGLS